jgi:uncharacterized Tic20 family protein
MNTDPMGYPEPPRGPARGPGAGYGAGGDPWQPRPAGEVRMNGTLAWERNYVLAVHLSMIASVMMLPVVPAFVLWLIKKDESAFVNQQAREVLNAQISWLIYALGFGVLAFLFLITTTVFAMCLIMPLSLAFPLVPIVHCVQGAMAANRGESFAYPMIMRLVG